jgi:Fur family transcriptional regulator, ferric uptake regulator
MPSSDAQKIYEDYLAKKHLKKTKQRQTILDVFLGIDSHVSLDQLLNAVHAQLPNLGMATVYRTMKLLVDAGIAHERRFEDSLTCYERADSEHHDHLICINCNRIIEFEDPEIEARQEAIAEQYGFRITSHRLELYGQCRDCLA